MDAEREVTSKEIVQKRTEEVQGQEADPITEIKDIERSIKEVEVAHQAEAEKGTPGTEERAEMREVEVVNTLNEIKDCEN